MVAKQTTPDMTSQDWVNWRANLDAAHVNAERIALAFLAQAQDTPNMTVKVLAGALMIGGALTEIAAQNTGTITAPVGNPRIDRVVLNPATGGITVVTGTPAASPVAPAVPADRLPICRFQLSPSTTAIANSMIFDERVLTSSGVPANSITLDKLARVGTAGQVLTSNGPGADPSYQAPQGLPRSYLAGLGLARNSGTPTTHLDIAAGAARDSTNAADLTLAAMLTKRLDAAWAVGTGNGGLDTGSRAANTWYHVHAIRRPDTGVVDALFSLSATAPTMPTNYTQFRRIGSIRTDGSSSIRDFRQIENNFFWQAQVADVVASNPGTGSRTLYTLTVPTGVKVRPLFRINANTVTDRFLVTSPDEEPDVAAGAYGASPGFDFGALSSANSNFAGFAGGTVFTDMSGRIGVRGSTGNTIDINTRGWIDARGVFA